MSLYKNTTIKEEIVNMSSTSLYVCTSCTVLLSTDVHDISGRMTFF